MRTRLSRRIALASAAVMLISAIGVPSATAASAISSCSYNAATGALSATFTPNAAGRYAWAWSLAGVPLRGGSGLVSGATTKTATAKRGLSGVLVFGLMSVTDPNDTVTYTC